LGIGHWALGIGHRALVVLFPGLKCEIFPQSHIVSGCIGIVQTINSQQPTANSQQSTVNSQQSTVNSQQPTVNSQQPTVNSQQSTANSQQPTANSQQSTVNSQHHSGATGIDIIFNSHQKSTSTRPRQTDNIKAIYSQLQRVLLPFDRLLYQLPRSKVYPHCCCRNCH